MNETETHALREFLLSFADDEHLMGQQHTEWIGVAPFLEEDLAFSSIGQDELGHAVMLYELVCEIDGIEPTDNAIDALAYRSAEEYRSCALTEYVTTDWAEALVRHWIYDTFEAMRWALVADSSYGPLADAAVRSGREEVFHLRHANALLDVLMDHPDSRTLLTKAAFRLEPLAYTLCGDTSSAEDQLVAGGVLSEHVVTLDRPLLDAMRERFGVSHRTRDLIGYSRDEERSDHFAPLMIRMREVLDLDPNAAW